MALAATGVLTRKHFRSMIDWPFLIFLGVILSMPAMIHHIGVDAQLAQALPPLSRAGASRSYHEANIRAIRRVRKRYLLQLARRNA